MELTEWSFLNNFSDYEVEQKSNKGIRKTFEDWPKLPNEIKQLIIYNMDYITRYKLSLCSKSDNRNVNEARWEIYSMRIEDAHREIYNTYGDEPVRFVSLSIRFDKKSEEHLRLKFVEEKEQEGKCCLLRKIDKLDGWPKKSWKKKSKVFENQNYRTVALNFIEQFLRKGLFKLKDLSIEMDSSKLQQIFIKTMKHVVSFRMVTIDIQYLQWWMEKLEQPQLDNLVIIPRGSDNQESRLSSEFMEQVSSQILSSKKLVLFGSTMLTEKQFFNLNSTLIHLIIDEQSNITPRTLNTFIKKWIAGDIREDFSELQVFIHGFYNDAEILAGIEANAWDDAFWDQSYMFCEDFVFQNEVQFCYEIRNKKNDLAATLHLEDGRFIFVVTGIFHCGRFIHRIPKYEY